MDKFFLELLVIILKLLVLNVYILSYNILTFVLDLLKTGRMLITRCLSGVHRTVILYLKFDNNGFLMQ